MSGRSRTLESKSGAHPVRVSVAAVSVRIVGQVLHALEDLGSLLYELLPAAEKRDLHGGAHRLVEAGTAEATHQRCRPLGGVGLVRSVCLDHRSLHSTVLFNRTKKINQSIKISKKLSTSCHLIVGTKEHQSGATWAQMVLLVILNNIP